jgi:dihydroorotase-like cyclic amidohydrolase
MITIPGLIDPHVHLREPGDTQKEDWTTGTAAALAGGYTCVLAMPNTKPPLVDARALDEITAIAGKKALCDFGLYIGAGAENASAAAALAAKSAGLKMYLDQTFGPLRLDGLASLSAHTPKAAAPRRPSCWPACTGRNSIWRT